MSNMPQDWTRNDFLALALNYAAQADLTVTDSENNFIKSMCGEEHFAKAAAFNAEHSDFAVVQAISAQKEHFFPGASGTEELVSLLTGLFNADDDYSHLEQNVMRGLKRIF